MFTSGLILAALVALIDPIYYKRLAPRRWLFLTYHTLTLFAVLLEDVFDLVLASAEMRYAVQLVWRKERTVGVLFCGDAV